MEKELRKIVYEYKAPPIHLNLKNTYRYDIIFYGKSGGSIGVLKHGSRRNQQTHKKNSKE